MSTNWTIRQVLGLAPDHYTAKSSRALASPEKWTALGQQGRFAWGEIPLMNKAPQRICIDLDGPAFDCSCLTRKTPCRHALALALLRIQQPEAFPQTDMPDWVAAWQPGSYRQPAAAQPDTPTAENRRRLALVRRAMAELGLWLEDLLVEGLAGAAQRPKATWEQAANRLVDGQAGQIAAEVRQLGALVNRRRDWPEQFMRQAGRLYLLTRAFARYDALDPARQGDLRAATGWLPRRFGLPDDPARDDAWQVVGRQTEQVERQFVYRTWLWGLATNRPALLARTTYDRRAGLSLLTTGATLTGEISFAPGGWPHLAALPDTPPRYGISLPDTAGSRSVEAAWRNYTTAVGANPWLRVYPFLLREVFLVEGDGRWLLADAAGLTLPLIEDHPQLYHLLALSGGRPFTLFGEWTRDRFYPLSIHERGRWYDLHALGEAA